jgi:hypothetical protein
MKKTLGAALLVSTMMMAPAFAQSNTTQTASAAGLWQGSKLIHMDVYNTENQKIGDIKELMVDKTGKIESAVIGVGGFLGMGEHDVAIKFGELKWSNQKPSNNSASSSSGATTGTGSAGAANTTYPDHAILNASKDQLKAMPNFDYSK